MSVCISAPKEMYRKAAEIAEAQHMSVDEVFAAAFADQLAAFERLRRLAARAAATDF